MSDKSKNRPAEKAKWFGLFFNQNINGINDIRHGADDADKRYTGKRNYIEKTKQNFAAARKLLNSDKANAKARERCAGHICTAERKENPLRRCHIKR